MKIFISHSWMDKTTAQMVADALSGIADVWLDLNKLMPGQNIQNAIDAAIKQMDLVILLWSKDAAASENVGKEIDSTKRLGVEILPCLLDFEEETRLKLEKNPNLTGLLGIDFIDRKIGVFRTQIAVMRKFSERTGIVDIAALNDLKSYEGVLNYVNDYRNKKGIAGEESAYWALKSIESTNQGFESISKWKDTIGGLLEIIQSTMARVDEAKNDRNKLQSILNDLIRNQYRDTKELKQLITFIEQKISTLPLQEKTAATTNSLESLVQKLVERISTASRKSIDQLRNQLQPILPAQTLNQAMEALAYYLESAPVSLQELAAAVEESPSVSLQQLALELSNYLGNPNDIISDDANGLLGYLDDAWLIHNSIYRCIEAGVLSVEQFSTDWNKIIVADQVALRLFSPQIRDMLNRLITQYLLTIAREIQSYQPSFNHNAYNQGYQSYDASMGLGSAVGGSSFIQNAQSIDDIFYTAGDKVYLMR